MAASERPPSLRPGDTVAIVPTARAITLEELRDGVALLERWGLRAKPGMGIGRKHFQFAGSDQERAADLQAAIDDPSVRAIWCARGGYGTVRLMPHLDLSRLERDPKWIIGFSDITVMHNAVHSMGLCSLHAQMPFRVGSKTEASRETIRAALFGEEYAIDTQLSGGVTGGTTDNRIGTCEGPVIGGNLSVLYSLRATPYDIDPRGKILFLEDLDELLYHVDRMAMNMGLSGWFDQLAGLIVGAMSEMRNKDDGDPFGMSAEEIIRNIVRDKTYPVCFHFPAGHVADNRAMVMGANAKLSVSANAATLSFEGSGAA